MKTQPFKINIPQMKPIEPNGQEAFGKPGIAPRWTHGDKEAVGTAYSAASQLWFTLWRGFVTEIYYPTVDRPQVRDLQYLITDGESFMHDELRDLERKVEPLDSALGYRVLRSDPEGRYAIEKTIIVDPHMPCLLQRTRVTGDEAWLRRLKLYVLCAPHLDGGGWGNNARVMEAAGRRILAAEKNGTWLALGATVPFARLSCGYVGKSDGWTDLADNFRMDWEFDRATDGNVALTGEIDLSETREFTLGLSLSDCPYGALTHLFQALAVPFDEQRERFEKQWARAAQKRGDLENASGDGGKLYRASCNLLLAHEDKTYQGALIASLSIPWGETRGDKDGLGGYHLVWTRDMVNSAMGLLAAGNRQTPLRALIYLATNQLADGSFPQTFWINGQPDQKNIQLDQVSFPIMLAHRLWRDNALADFDPFVTVMRAAGYLMRQGPATQQERWEETSGYSPSTLASNIAALICASDFARDRGDEEAAVFLEEYADFIEGNLETWTVTEDGTLLPEVKRHYVRLNPVQLGDALPDRGLLDRDKNDALIPIPNQQPGTQEEFPAKEVVDAGFLELVRYGIRRADDPLIVDSLRVVDAQLKVETPFGACWRRYNHDGYGQGENGEPYAGIGRGRAWPLLTGERGHHAVAAGGDARSYLQTLEGLASPTGLLPEQVWDAPDNPQAHMWLGKPTGAAMPLLWAHAEYVKLLRSVNDGRVFDLIPEVAQRYGKNHRHCHKLKIWSFRFPAAVIRRGHRLRVLAEAEFRLRFSRDDWATAEEAASVATPFGLHYTDLPVAEEHEEQAAPVRFTFFWPDAQRWEGRDFSVALQE